MYTRGNRRPRHPGARTNVAEVLDGLVGELDSCKFVIGRLMELSNALGRGWLSQDSRWLSHFRSSMVGKFATWNPRQARAALSP